MPQNSVAYAVARVHVQSRDALDAARVERLLAADGYQEALRTLSEIGFGGADAGMDAEAVAAEHVLHACTLVRQVSPCPEATDSFLLRYDGLNLKTLLKARTLGQKPPLLSACGIFPVEQLSHAVDTQSYKGLPDSLREALEELEKTLAVRADALAIDTTVDRAIYTLIGENMRAVKSPVIRGYFVSRADLLGAVMLLRALRMGRGLAFFRQMLLPGGKITQAQWEAAFERPETLPALLEPLYGRAVGVAAAAAVQDADRLPALEKAMDDALLAPFSALKKSLLRLEPLVGYLLGAEREAAAVRLILAGKAGGFAPEAVRERLRELYGT